MTRVWYIVAVLYPGKASKIARMGTDVHKTLRGLLTTLTVVAIVIPGISGYPSPAVAEDTAAVEQLSLAAEASTTEASGPFITGIGVVKNVKGTTVSINCDAVLPFEYSVIEGKNLIIDVPGAGSKVWPDVQQIDDPIVSRVRISEIIQPKRMVRVVFDLLSAGAFTVKEEGSAIVVQFASRPGTAGGGCCADHSRCGAIAASSGPQPGLGARFHVQGQGSCLPYQRKNRHFARIHR